MLVILCLPDAGARDFCKKRIKELAEADCAEAVVKVLNSNSLRYIKNSVEKFVSADLIVIGIDAGFDGIEAARILREAEINADIVFFTRDRDRVFEAFDVDALNYLVDGEASLAKFDEVFRKARRRSETRFQSSIVLNCAGERRKIPLNQIYYFEVKNRIVTVHYIGGTFEFYSTISRIEDSLANRGFIRIHRSYLAAEMFITGISHGRVVLVNGDVLPLGGRYTDSIKL